MRLRCAALLIACLTLAMVIVDGGAQAAGVVTSDQGCTQRTSSASLNQAGLVITFGDGRTLTYCIEFAEETITGLELLQRSRLQLVISNAGGVCRIEEEGCQDPVDCFCKCKGGSCAYWVYYQYKDGAWLYSPVGAGGRTVRNGDADGWAWGSGSSTKPNADNPACAAPPSTPTPIPTPTPQLTATPTPQRTATPRPSATPTPRGPSPTITALPTPAGADPPTPGTPPPSTQPAASLPLVPTVAVLSERRTAAASATPGGRASATATAAPALTTPSGVIRVSPEEGERNLSARPDGGSSNWLSFASFGIVAAALAGLAAILFWRRRAGI